MIITRAMAAAVVFAGAAVGLASPAWAEELSGTYNLTYHNTGDVRTWTITPCGAGCANIVTNAGPGQARLDGSQWTMSIDRPDAIECFDDGRKLPGTQHLRWDATTLAGAAFSTAPVMCDGKANERTPDRTFTLTKVS